MVVEKQHGGKYMNKFKLFAVSAMAIGILGASSISTFANEKVEAAKLVVSIEAIEASENFSEVEKVAFVELTKIVSDGESKDALTLSTFAIAGDASIELINLDDVEMSKVFPIE